MTSSGTPIIPCTSSSSSYCFEGFLHGLHHHQEQLLAEITAVVADDKAERRDGEDEVAKELVARALGQFEEYYEHKSRALHDNVFSFFAPPWCSSFECAFMWIAGFRPGVLLELVSDSVRNLSPRQMEAIQRLKRETRMEERQVADELARVQESVAAPTITHALSGARWSTEEQPFTPTTNEPIEQLQVVLEEVVANADCLRVSTAASVAEILTPAQGLRFLAAALRLEQGMRVLQIERNNRAARERSRSARERS